MLHSSSTFIARLSLHLMVVTLVTAQTPAGRMETDYEDSRKMCALAKAADQVEHDSAMHRESALLRKALGTEAKLWKFLIDPATPYQDRIGAAVQGVNLLSAKDLPALWKASAEFETAPTGVDPSPCQFEWPRADYVGAWYDGKFHPARDIAGPPGTTILGVFVKLPRQRVDFPIDAQAREKAPWPWQVARAVGILERGEERIFGQPDRYPEMAEVALRWQPATYYERRIRLQNLLAGDRYGDAYHVEVMMRLCLQEEGFGCQLDGFGPRTAHITELIHTGQIVVLQQVRASSIALGAALEVAEMARQRAGWQFRPTATSLLAIAKWTEDTAVDLATRYEFAEELCKASRNSECANGLEKGKPLLRFEAWLAAERPRLLEEAAKERAMLAECAAEIHARIGRD